MPKRTELPALYPCDFPIKVIGCASTDFETDVLAIMKQYLGEIRADQIGRRNSAGGKYLSLTFHIVAQSREYLEKLYGELNACPSVILVI